MIYANRLQKLLLKKRFVILLRKSFILKLLTLVHVYVNDFLQNDNIQKAAFVIHSVDCRIPEHLTFWNGLAVQRYYQLWFAFSDSVTIIISFLKIQYHFITSTLFHFNRLILTLMKVNIILFYRNVVKLTADGQYIHNYQFFFSVDYLSNRKE